MVKSSSESCQTLRLFSSFSTKPAEVAASVKFNGNQSRSPFLGQVVDIDLLLYAEFSMCLNDDRKIKQNNEHCCGL